MRVPFLRLNTPYGQNFERASTFYLCFYIFTALMCFYTIWMFVYCAAVWSNKRNNKNLYIGRFWKQCLSRCFMGNLFVTVRVLCYLV